MPRRKGHSHVRGTVARRSGWIALIVLATLVGSFVFTCATPFAALAALAALHMQRRDAFILIGMNWLANQAVGFGLLDYPRTWDCLAGGLAIGAAAALATAAAAGAERAVRSHGRLLTLLACFAAAFATYELTIHAAAAMQSSGQGDFIAEVTMYILKVNAVAFGGLLLLQRAADWLGLAPARRPAGLAATTS